MSESEIHIDGAAGETIPIQMIAEPMPPIVEEAPMLTVTAEEPAVTEALPHVEEEGKRFMFELKQVVRLKDTPVTGTVTARAEHVDQDHTYCIDVYGEGQVTRQWWGEADLVAL